jgi:hypothetical protein
MPWATVPQPPECGPTRRQAQSLQHRIGTGSGTAAATAAGRVKASNSAPDRIDMTVNLQAVGIAKSKRTRGAWSVRFFHRASFPAGAGYHPAASTHPGKHHETHNRRYAPFVLVVALAPLPALAARCDLNGEEVNTDNGSTTAGKSGILKCYRDGKIWREQELRNGEYLGTRQALRRRRLDLGAPGQQERQYRGPGARVVSQQAAQARGQVRERLARGRGAELPPRRASSRA